MVKAAEPLEGCIHISPPLATLAAIFISDFTCLDGVAIAKQRKPIQMSHPKIKQANRETNQTRDKKKRLE